MLCWLPHRSIRSISKSCPTTWTVVMWQLSPLNIFQGFLILCMLSSSNFMFELWWCCILLNLQFYTLRLYLEINVMLLTFKNILLLCVVCLVSLSVCLLAVHLTVSADVTSLKSRLHFQDNGQSVYSGYLSLPKKHCQPLRVGLLVRH